MNFFYYLFSDDLSFLYNLSVLGKLSQPSSKELNEWVGSSHPKSRLSISFIDIFPQLVPLNSLLGLECWRPVRAQHNWLGMIPLLNRDRWKFWWLQSLKNNSVQFLKDNYNNWNGYFSKFQDHSQSLCYQSVYVESIMFVIWWFADTKTWIKTPCWQMFCSSGFLNIFEIILQSEGFFVSRPGQAGECW